MGKYAGLAPNKHFVLRCFERGEENGERGKFELACHTTLAWNPNDALVPAPHGVQGFQMVSSGTLNKMTLIATWGQTQVSCEQISTGPKNGGKKEKKPIRNDFQ